MEHHKRDLLDTKKSHEERNSRECWRQFAHVPRGHPKTVREGYMRIKLQKDTHCLWTERKVLLQLNSDDELARFLFDLAEVSARPLIQFKSDEYLQDTGPFSSNSQGRATSYQLYQLYHSYRNGY